MANTILLFTLFIVASVNASFVWQNDDNFGKTHEFKFHQLNFPQFPTFPTFHRLNFPAFPTFPTIPPIVIPTPEDIAKNKGPHFNGVSVSTSSSSTVDKNGKVIETGGTTIVTNKDGVVKQFVFGDNPQNVPNPPIIVPQVPIFPPRFSIPIITPEDIKNIKPIKNGNFIGTSSSSFTQATNVNGVQTSIGGGSLVSNVNGNVQEKVIKFGSKTP